MAWQLTGAPAAPAAGDERPPALSVGEALARAKGALEGMTLVVEGEVSQFRDSPAYKAVYFPLADGSSVMDCMMWRNRYGASGVRLVPGARVRLTGRFTVYPAKGRMQFEVFRLEEAGAGDLRERVARLARRLQAEGLMDPARKLPVPAFCERVAVVTSPHGKVKDDVARTLRRRNPLVELLFCPVRVEGADAAALMVEALRVAEAAAPDAVLLVRGGGSYEDLMPFNDEALARAVAACRVPVVTGIGHEPDTTVCDMVADLRASTPTYAAAAVAPSVEELSAALDVAAGSMARSLGRRVGELAHRLDLVASRPVLADPVAALCGTRAAYLDFAHDRLAAALPNMVVARRASLAAAGSRLAAQGPRLAAGPAQRTAALAARLAAQGPRLTERPAQRTEALAGRLASSSRALLAGPQRRLAVSAARLEALSPLAVIARGYAMATDARGAVVSSVGQAAPGAPLTVRLADGTLDCEVRAVNPGA